VIASPGLLPPGRFFKSIGGALGAAVFGAILAHGLASGHSAHAYREVFGWTVPVVLVSLILALHLREKPLSAEMIDVAEGKVEVQEY
jgi:hypothetical protein